MLFVESTESPALVTWGDEAGPLLMTEYLHSDAETRYSMFKILTATAKYNRGESILIAQAMLVLLSEGPQAMQDFMLAEAVAAGVPIP
jgi:hypothetical protein